MGTLMGRGYHQESPHSLSAYLLSKKKKDSTSFGPPTMARRSGQSSQLQLAPSTVMLIQNIACRTRLSSMTQTK